MTKANIEGKSLLDTYLSYHDLMIRFKTQDAKPDGMIFMPLLLMDAMNMLYEEYIGLLPLKHREKQISKRWHEAFLHFTKQEFIAFDIDQQAEMCDIMNDFENTIHNDIEAFRVAVMNRFMEYDLEVRLVLSATLACNILAQSAEYIWLAMRGKRNANHYITSVVDWSHKFLNEYGDKNIDRNVGRIDISSFQDVQIAVNKLCKSIANYSQSLVLW